jgi:hypothetical protein
MRSWKILLFIVGGFALGEVLKVTGCIHKPPVWQTEK